MYSLLLKKALPFTLTLAAGVALSGLAGLAGLLGGEKKTERVLVTRTYDFGGRCRTRTRRLVAETKPLVILFKPDAVLPHTFTGALGMTPARVLVTLGSDGRVQAVEPLDEYSVKAWRDWPAGGGDPFAAKAWQAVERAARQIRFEPETVNGIPVSVTKEVEIRFQGH